MRVKILSIIKSHIFEMHKTKMTLSSHGYNGPTLQMFYTGWGYSLVVESFPSISEALDSISTRVKISKFRNNETIKCLFYTA